MAKICRSLLRSLVMATLLFPVRSYLNVANPTPLSSLRVASKRMSSKTSSGTSDEGDHALFGRFRIAPEHIFYRSERSIAFVNLRPIVAGHVLVMSKKNVPHLRDLNDDEYLDLWSTVRKVQGVLEQQHQKQQLSFNVAVQDGRHAGQSVPHVHVHILPRTPNDFARNDDVYTELEEWAPRSTGKEKASLDVPDDVERTDRTPEEMAEEAAMYRSYMARL